MVVEVLSAATRERDLNHKRMLYCDHGVAWYLIADPGNGAIELLQFNDPGVYVPIPVRESMDLTICHDYRLTIDLLWCLSR